MKNALYTLSFLSGLLFMTPALGANLIPNGDFESGNTQFGSDYDFTPAFNNTEGQYTVRTDPFPWNPNFISSGDHTSGSGNMFVGNGAPVDERVWFSSSIDVDPNTDYFFEAWVMNVCCNPTFGQSDPDEPINPAVLSFYANGVLLGTQSTDSLGEWEGLSTTWNSGLSTTVDLELRNSNLIAAGNDFAVDDVFLGTETSIPSTPEPSTLLGLGTLALAGGTLLRRKRKA